MDFERKSRSKIPTVATKAPQGPEDAPGCREAEAIEGDDREIRGKPSPHLLILAFQIALGVTNWKEPKKLRKKGAKKPHLFRSGGVTPLAPALSFHQPVIHRPGARSDYQQEERAE